MQISVHRLVPAGVLIAAAIWAPWMLASPQGLDRLRILSNEKRRLATEVVELGRDIGRLREQARLIKTSPRSVERVARDELGLVRQTELVVQFEVGHFQK